MLGGDPKFPHMLTKHVVSVEDLQSTKSAVMLMIGAWETLVFN